MFTFRIKAKDMRNKIEQNNKKEVDKIVKWFKKEINRKLNDSYYNNNNYKIYVERFCFDFTMEVEKELKQYKENLEDLGYEVELFNEYGTKVVFIVKW